MGSFVQVQPCTIVHRAITVRYWRLCTDSTVLDRKLETMHDLTIADIAGTGNVGPNPIPGTYSQPHWDGARNFGRQGTKLGKLISLYTYRKMTAIIIKCLLRFFSERGDIG